MIYKNALFEIKNIISLCGLCVAIDDIIKDAEFKNLQNRKILESIANYDGMLCGAAENKINIARDALRLGNQQVKGNESDG